MKTKIVNQRINNSSSEKKMRKKNILILIILFVTTIVFAISEDQIRQRGEENLKFKKNVYEKTLAFINEHPNYPDLATVYFNLAEVSVDVNVDNPRLTAKYYKKVLEYNPDFIGRDAIIYNYAYHYVKSEKLRISNQQNEILMSSVDDQSIAMNWPDSLRLNPNGLQPAIDAYKDILTNMPNSEYYSEVLYRLGSLYFDIALDARDAREYYKESIKYFDILANRKNDELQPYGLFHRAWSNFTSGLYEKAIDDFSKILKIVAENKNSNQTQYFESDAIENIAFSLTQYDENDFEQKSKAAEKAKETFLSLIDEKYGKNILNKAIQMKLDLNAPMQAIDLYNSYISLYPTSLEIPTYIDSIITVYKRYPDRIRDNDLESSVIDEMIRLVTSFKVDSEWYINNHDLDGAGEQIAIIKNAYEQVEPRFVNAMAKNINIENITKVETICNDYTQYEEFMDEKGKKWIEDERYNLLNARLILAENSKKVIDYFKAIDYINDFNSKYPNNKKLLDNKALVFNCKESIYNSLRESVKTSSYVDKLNNIEFSKKSLDSLFITAINDYQELLLNKKYKVKEKETELIRIVYIRTQIYFSNEEYEQASNGYKYLLDLKIDKNIKKIAFSNLAEISRIKGDYIAAEKLYKKALQVSKDTNEINQFESNIIGMIQANADTLKNTGRYVEAALEYLRLAEKNKNDVNQNIAYKREAVKMYDLSGKYQESINLILDIAKNQKEKSTKLSLYVKAWTIADSLLVDFKQGEKIRNKFVDLYPRSNEAFKIRLDIIGLYEGERFNDKEKAAKMYLELHKKSANYDLGDVKKESLYLRAIALYKQLNNKKKEMALMEDFEKLYPAHEISNQFLVSVATYYKDNGNDKKFRSLAKYLKRKDPNIDLLSVIAEEELLVEYQKIEKLFSDKNYDEMLKEIKNYKTLESKYVNDGFNVVNESVHSQFSYFNDFIKYHKKYDRILKRIDSEFLNASSQSIFIVNSNTKWKENMVPRYKKLLAKTNNYKDELISLLSEGENYEITVAQSTKLFVLVAKCYEKGADVFDSQFKKYVAQSKEYGSLNELGEATYRRVSNYFRNEAIKYKMSFINLTKSYYNHVYKEYYLKTEDRDEWMLFAYEKALQYGIAKPLITEHISVDSLWTINNFDIVEELNSALEVDSIWIPMTVSENNLEQELLKNNLIIRNDNQFKSYMKRNIYFEIKPDVVYFNYVSLKPIELMINNSIIDKESTIKDTILTDSGTLYHYNVFTTKYAIQGENSVVILSNSDSDLKTFELSYDYDKETLEYFRTTEKRMIVSDYAWVTSREELDETNLVADSTWDYAVKGNPMFFNVQIFDMEKSEALPIWGSDYDTLNVETVYFAKTFPVEVELLSADIKLIGNEYTSLWINGKKFIDNEQVILDTTTNQAVPIMLVEVDTELFKQGKNTIIAKVKSTKKDKAFRFEMFYTVKKEEENKVNYELNENDQNDSLENENSEFVKKNQNNSEDPEQEKEQKE